MKKIKEKLTAQTGASLLIALVFMMFCCFVGGSILAAATQQMTYVKRMTQTEQQYLSQRSAITLISDSLKSYTSNSIRLMVADKNVTTDDVTVTDGGVENMVSRGEPQRELSFIVSGADERSIMQRFILETSILRYLDENGLGDDIPISITGFGDLYTPAEGAEEDTYDPRDDFIAMSAGIDSGVTIQVTDPTSTDSMITAYVTSGEGDNRYNFIISFGEDSSQVVMTMHSHITNRPTQVSAPEYKNTGTNRYNKVTVESSVFIIDWDEPVLEKGGLED